MTHNTNPTYSPASSITDRTLVWVAYREGRMMIKAGEPFALPAAAIAAAYRKRYA